MVLASHVAPVLPMHLNKGGPGFLSRWSCYPSLPFCMRCKERVLPAHTANPWRQVSPRQGVHSTVASDGVA